MADACRASRQRAFTLLEVLVALVIVALGMIAVFGQLSQSATAATRLRDKTLAHWVAMDRLAELRLLREFPAEGERTEDVEMAGIEWRYTIRVANTPIEDLRRVDVSVAFADAPGQAVSSVTGFLAQVTGGGTTLPKTADWYFVDPANPGELPQDGGDAGGITQ